MDQRVAIPLGRALLTIAAVAFCAWIASWAIGGAMAATLGPMAAYIALERQGVFRRPLTGAWGWSVVIVVWAALAIGATFMVVPIWSPRLSWWWAPEWFNGAARDPWGSVCWPVLLGEHALIVLIAGGLLTCVARCERRRQAKSG